METLSKIGGVILFIGLIPVFIILFIIGLSCEIKNQTHNG